MLSYLMILSKGSKPQPILKEHLKNILDENSIRKAHIDRAKKLVLRELGTNAKPLMRHKDPIPQKLLSELSELYSESKSTKEKISEATSFIFPSKGMIFYVLKNWCSFIASIITILVNCNLSLT